jgi:hypothetical protein
MRRARAATVIAVAVAVAASPTVASAGGGHGAVTTVAEGLDGPRQLNSFVHGKLVVAESDTGEVSSVDPSTGRVRTLLSNLPTPQGVDYRDGLLFVALGEAAPPEDAAQVEAAKRPEAGPTSLIVARPTGRIVKTYDLLDYELRKNPDGQPQFDPVTKEPLDTLSNPFSVHAQSGRILVADAGANAVLAIDRRTHRISTFFVPPRVPVRDVPECEGTNDAQGVQGCDPVPTGVTEDEHGNIYVSTLGGDQPNAGRVYVLSPHGKLLRVIKDLEPLTGIAVDDDGDIYVSCLFAGLAGPPPTDEEGAEPIGEVVKIGRDGDRSSADVTLPTGLEFQGGKLYASAWSVAAFIGLFGRGEVVRVSHGAFD